MRKNHHVCHILEKGRAYIVTGPNLFNQEVTCWVRDLKCRDCGEKKFVERVNDKKEVLK